MEDFSQFLFLFAVIILSFIRWVINRLQEGRQQREFEAEMESEQQRTGREPAPPEIPSSAGEAASAQSANEKGLQDLLEAFGLPQTPPESEEEPEYWEPIPEDRAEPPPIPDLPESPPERLGGPSGSPAPAMTLKRLNKNRRKHQVGHLLRTRGSFQTAFILKEVLDTPKGLKSSEELHYFPSEG
ncbi:MAG: hypothetical protein AAF514_13185 [Verrucomicrobiota bacterium]